MVPDREMSQMSNHAQPPPKNLPESSPLICNDLRFSPTFKQLMQFWRDLFSAFTCSSCRRSLSITSFFSMFLLANSVCCCKFSSIRYSMSKFVLSHLISGSSTTY